ncbi:Hypothetical protein NGAL_HAMBI490_60750 [Neorhizobium galegae bv. officinalis]|nr:Hypothetical protein NGAL_HAMBI490_60750 [Neorhizobium galegae bv. officinalis]
MKKEEIINRGTNAKQFLESAVFIETIRALKAMACEQMWKTALDDTQSREELHAQMLNWNLCESQLKKWVVMSDHALKDDGYVPEA